MKYYLELRIDQYMNPKNLEEELFKPLNNFLNHYGNVSIVIPEYQSYQSDKKELVKLEVGRKELYFKYIKIHITLTDIKKGLPKIRFFLQDLNLLKKSILLFRDERYNLLENDLLQI